MSTKQDVVVVEVGMPAWLSELMETTEPVSAEEGEKYRQIVATILGDTLTEVAGCEPGASTYRVGDTVERGRGLFEITKVDEANNILWVASVLSVLDGGNG